MRGLPGFELAAHAASWGIDCQPFLRAVSRGERRVQAAILTRALEMRVEVEEARARRGE